MTALGGKPALFVVEAVATPPLTASAKLVSVRLAADAHASTSVMRDQFLPTARVIQMRIRSVAYGANVTLRFTS